MATKLSRQMHGATGSGERSGAEKYQKVKGKKKKKIKANDHTGCDLLTVSERTAPNHQQYQRQL